MQSTRTSPSNGNVAGAARTLADLVGDAEAQGFRPMQARAIPIRSTETDEFKAHLADLDEAFPKLDPGIEPLGGRVLVQLRSAKKSKKIKRHDGTEVDFHYTDYSQEVERDVQQVARLISIGPLAFRDKKTLEPWPECGTNEDFKPWASPGDYIKVPKYGGDKHYMPIPGRGKDDRAVFVVINEHEIISKITCNPLHIIAYL